MGGFDMDEKHLLQLLEQVRDQEGDWRVALEDAIDMVSSQIPEDDSVDAEIDKLVEYSRDLRHSERGNPFVSHDPTRGTVGGQRFPQKQKPFWDGDENILAKRS